MSEVVYNTIGIDYNKNRAADPRIVAVVRELLDLPVGSVVADIGAGTGNYANALAECGYYIKAVEPSGEMIKQSKPNNNVDWFQGTAEAIPLNNASVSGVIVIFAIHHFSDIERAVKEMARICPEGPVAVLTLDPRECETLWFDTYFPEVAQHVFHRFLPLSELIDTITDIGKWSATVKAFPLPPDLIDRSMHSAWNKPEMYLDAGMRQNISPFALTPLKVVQQRVAKLQVDLESGEWDRNFGYIRKLPHFDAGYRFLVFRKDDE